MLCLDRCCSNYKSEICILRTTPRTASIPVPEADYSFLSGAIGACPSAGKKFTVGCLNERLQRLRPWDARVYYTELFKHRADAERRKHEAAQQRLLREAAARGHVRSGGTVKAQWDLRAEYLDALAIGLVEDVLTIYQERELVLTPAICTCLANTAREHLDTVYQKQLQLSADGMLGFHLLNSSVQEMSTRKFAAMPKINIMIERARLAGVKKSEIPSNVTINNSYTQNITGSHNNVTMRGNVTSQQQYTVNDFNQLAVELESLCHTLGAQPFTIYTEDLKLLEDAEEAARKHDQTTLRHYVEKVSEDTWEFAKSAGMEVGKQALIAFLKTHGIPLP